eukprot:6444063-Amphidinium_carterae.2
MGKADGSLDHESRTRRSHLLEQSVSCTASSYSAFGLAHEMSLIEELQISNLCCPLTWERSTTIAVNHHMAPNRGCCAKLARHNVRAQHENKESRLNEQGIPAGFILRLWASACCSLVGAFLPSL